MARRAYLVWFLSLQLHLLPAISHTFVLVTPANSLIFCVFVCFFSTWRGQSVSIQWQRKDKGFWTCSLNATPLPPLPQSLGEHLWVIHPQDRAEADWERKCKCEQMLSGESSEGQTSGHRTFLPFFCVFEIFQHQVWEEGRSLKYS